MSMEQARSIHVALAQWDLVVGDVAGNTARILEAIELAETSGAQVLALPELAITGYPPEDLLHKPSFVSENLRALDVIAGASRQVLTVLGFVDRDEGGLYNAAAICQNGTLVATYRKQLLPNYGVFDEQRYFKPGVGNLLFETQAGIIGVCICEDAWTPTGPLVAQGDAGAEIVININASPFHKDKDREREQMLCDRARRAQVSIAYVNTVGGQDELVFDGGSLAIDPHGQVIHRMPQFEEAFGVIEMPLGAVKGTSPGATRLPVTLLPQSPVEPAPSGEALSGAAEVYQALTLSLRDYVRKNGFSKIVIGLSGGIDSSLTAAIGADALGPENVLGVAMPSEFSTSHSVSDAVALAENLGIEMITMKIAAPYHAYLDSLEAIYGPTEMGVAEENLQARIRGTLLMAISNRYGHLVIATGNKSEMAVGYATLYGDMAGGFALLKDVFKTEVYELCKYRNSIGPAIPENVMTKPPSAELRPGQKDSDSLPPYDILDPILDAYVEEDASVKEIVAKGFDRDTVRRVIAMVDRTEYKRRQAAPGPKVTTKAFGRDRRLPITNRWHEDRDVPLPGAPGPT